MGGGTVAPAWEAAGGGGGGGARTGAAAPCSRQHLSSSS